MQLAVRTKAYFDVVLERLDVDITRTLSNGLGKDMILGLGFYAQGRVRSQLPRKELRKPMFQMRSGECGMRKAENGEHC